MNKQETIADIIAEMRALSNSTSDGIIAINGRIVADRIGAAWKREKSTAEKSSAVGDRAKLREAVEKIAAMPVVDEECQCPECVRRRTVRDIARAALAAPPRNCDRFGGETEAMVAFLNEKWLVGVADLKDYPFCEWSHVMKAMYAKWLLAPSTEQKGGANE